ncbi:MAG: hypothetical protein COB46_05430 [Rhodospirillaceae bacterium]|nr:MAG: hypothetical protein COB46_05430 [Rhodospirillaceae bacterium]
MTQNQHTRNPITLFFGVLTVSFLIFAVTSLVLLRSSQEKQQQHSYDETGLAALQVRLHYEMLLGKLAAVESATLQGSVDDAVVAFDVLYERLKVLPGRPTYDKLLDEETLALQRQVLTALTQEIPFIDGAADGDGKLLLGMYQRLLPLKHKVDRLGHRPVQVASDRRAQATQDLEDQSNLFFWIITGFIVSGLIFTIVIFRQLKTQHNLSESLRRSRDEAEQASAAKSQFLSHMSHEFRTPMNAILGFAQLLDMDKLEFKHQQSVKQILNSGNEMLSLINQVLALEHINVGNVKLDPTPVEPKKVLQECYDMLRTNAADRDVQVRIVEPDQAVANIFVTDHLRLQQIIFCLLSNAINYNRPQGTVSMFVEMASDLDIKFSVQDTGVGIPLDQQDDVFQAFNRLGREAQDIQGTGVGLTIAHELVKLLGGSIHFTSIPGQGSTFWIVLPLIPPPVPITNGA